MYGRCMGKSIIFSVFFFHFFTMQPNFFLIFLLFYCTAVKTVKCTMRRTSSADSLRKPFCKTCRCAHLPTAWVGAHYLTHSLTHWVRSLTTTRSTSSYIVLASTIICTSIVGGRAHRSQTTQIRTCIVFLDHVQNLHIHAVRARFLWAFSVDFRSEGSVQMCPPLRTHLDRL